MGSDFGPEAGGEADPSPVVVSASMTSVAKSALRKCLSIGTLLVHPSRIGDGQPDQKDVVQDIHICWSSRPRERVEAAPLEAILVRRLQGQRLCELVRGFKDHRVDRSLERVA